MCRKRTQEDKTMASEKTRKVRMLKSTRGSTNGLDRHHYEAKSEHEIGTPLMPEHLAQAFLIGGDAEEVGLEDAPGQGKQASVYQVETVSGGEYVPPGSKQPGPSARKA
jgi:hypothetical protein